MSLGMKTAIIESSELQFAVRDYFITKERPSKTILQNHQIKVQEGDSKLQIELEAMLENEFLAIINNKCVVMLENKLATILDNKFTSFELKIEKQIYNKI